MAYDGKLQFNTAIDTAGFLKGIENIASIAQKGLGTIGNFAQKGIQGIVSLSESSAEAIKKSIDITVDGMKAVGEEALNLSKKAIEIGKGFESSMSQVAATMGITKDTINENGVKPFDILSEAAKECGATTQYSASEAAEALNYLALAGYTAEQAADALPSVLNLAAAGGLDLQYAADLATDAMAALGITANNQNLTEFGDKMAKAAQKSNTSVAQLGEAILTVGGTAKELAGGTTELNTALGILANVGIKGSEGGTALRNIMLAMTPTTDKAVAAFDKLNVSAYDVTTGALRPLNDTFKDLNKAMAGMNSKEKTETLNAIFNKVDLKSASAMLAACASTTEELGTAFAYAGVPAQNLTEFLEDFQNGVYNTMTETQFCESVMNDFGVTSEKAEAIYSAFVTQLNGVSFENLYNEIENSDGAMEQMAETMNDNLEGDLKIWNSALEGLGNTFYENVVGSLRQTVQDATKWIGQLDEAFKLGGFQGLAEEIPKVLSKMLGKAYLEVPKALELGTEIVETIGNGIKSSISQIRTHGTELIIKFAESFTENFSIFYDTGFSILAALVDGLSKSNGRLENTAYSFVSGIAETLEKNLPVITSGGLKIISKLAAVVLPELLKFGTQIIFQLTEGIKANSEEISLQAEEIMTAFAEFILENIPEILAAGLIIAESLLEGISESMNNIQPAIMDFIAEIGIIISEHLPELLETGFAILMSIISGITENLPQITETAISILTMLAEFIGDNIDLLIDSAVLIITTLCSSLITGENMEKLVGAAFAILGGIADGIAENLPLLIECATQIIGEIMRYLNDENNRQEILSGAGEIVGKLIRGLIDSLDEIEDFVAMLLVELGIAIAETDWNKLGSDIADGIMEGLLGVPFDSQEFKANFADNWVLGMKDILGIHSPSKLMRDEIGVYLVPGIAEGIADTSEQLTQEMDSVINSAVDAVDKKKSVNLEISSDADLAAEKLSALMEAAVMENQMKYAPITNIQPEINISNDIKTAFEDALSGAKLDGDTYLDINIGQERIESIIISAMEKYNARTGGRY